MMLEKLIEYMADRPPEELARVSLETAAVCLVWHESSRSARDDEPTVQRVRQALDVWTKTVAVLPPSSEGRRHQWILRDMISLAQTGRIREMGPDELDFLCAVGRLCGRAQNPAQFERVHKLLRPLLNELEVQRRVYGASSRDLLLLSNRLHVVTTEMLEQAPPRDVQIIAGIKTPGRGPLLRLSGHVKVLGSVPENCTLVVESGCCSVEGYVLGRIALENHCDVRENIAGMVIARFGDVRARNIIDRARVTAKLGEVHARRAQNPDLVFAGRRIEVREETRRGRYVAPEIRIHGPAVGGRYEATELVTAERFARPENEPALVVLRGELLSEMYGDSRPQDATRLLSQAIRARQQVANADSMAAAAEREIEQCAQSALYYICCQTDVQRLVESLQTAKNRLAFLERVIAGLYTLSTNLETHLASARIAVAAEVSAGGASPTMAFDDADSGLRALMSEGNAEQRLSDAMAELRRMRERLAGKPVNKRLAASTLAQLRRQVTDWNREHQELRGEVERIEARLRKAVNLGALRGESAADVSWVDLLGRMLALAREGRVSEAQKSRVESGFVRIMRRAIAQKRERAEDSLLQAQQKRRDFEVLSGKLAAEYAIDLSLDRAEEARRARVTGRFDAGVRIYADVFSAEDADGASAPIVVTPDGGDAVKTYERNLGQIVEVTE